MFGKVESACLIEDQRDADWPRILVVDDDEIDRIHSQRLLTEIFGTEQHLDFATNWEDAQAAVAANAHDIYIVDYLLGAGNGLQIIEDAAQDDETRVFILLTGNENRDVDMAATRAGVADYLIKKDLTVSRLERCLRYATEAMRQKRQLIEQAEDLRQAKAAIEEEVRKQKALTWDLKQAQGQLTMALARAEKSERRYRWLSQHDMLTKIPNRSLFAEKLREGLEQAARSETILALYLLDIDRFKWVNDTFGHQVGDTLLAEIAERLGETVRNSDVVARLGGDEFAIASTNLSDEHHASNVAEKIIAALSRPFEIAGHRIEAGASIGVSVSSGQDPADPDVMMQKADAALYSAKMAGRGAFRFFDQTLNDEVQRTLLLKKELPLAIEAGDFSLVYQPKVDLTRGQVTGFEVLVRWHHPRLGAVSPGEFIPVAESTGQIIPLSVWIFDQSLRTLADWKDSALSSIPLGLNLSAVQLKQKDLVAVIAGLLEYYDLDPALLDLEVTETAALENLDLAVAQLNKLRQLGVTISIDDFGTGYSSLALATRLPADCLKIDLSFVAGMLHNAADAAAVNATISLAHSLGIRVVAEGVETGQQLAQLRKQGCNEAQGYYFTKPLPEEELLNWYDAWRGRLLPAA